MDLTTQLDRMDGNCHLFPLIVGSIPTFEIHDIGTTKSLICPSLYKQLKEKNKIIQNLGHLTIVSIFNEEKQLTGRKVLEIVIDNKAFIIEEFVNFETLPPQCGVLIGNDLTSLLDLSYNYNNGRIRSGKFDFCTQSELSVIINQP